MKSLFLSTLLLGFFSPVKAEVDSKVAEFCLRAKDFEGCVRSMSSKSSDMPSMRIIEGGVELSGNSCPEGFAYAGAGKCRDVSRRVSDILKVDGFGLWASGLASRPNWAGWSRFGEMSVQAVLDPKCPRIEPFLYTRSSCQSKPEITDMKELKKALSNVVGSLSNPKVIEYWDNEFKRVFGVEGLASRAINKK
tara:strand:+ start:695 stop:1273 length:579 start_codon:yes stop_codon:yes gene_type:complete